ncbi:unnamed protein product [Discosporangium mesarthrocarpum]
MPSCNLVVWDLGGQVKLRGLWEHYVKDVSGVIFVLDSSDLARLREAETELATFLGSNDLSTDTAVLLLANKQDEHRSLNTDSLRRKMRLGNPTGTGLAPGADAPPWGSPSSTGKDSRDEYGAGVDEGGGAGVAAGVGEKRVLFNDGDGGKAGVVADGTARGWGAGNTGSGMDKEEKSKAEAPVPSGGTGGAGKSPVGEVEGVGGGPAKVDNSHMAEGAGGAAVMGSHRVKKSKLGRSGRLLEGRRWHIQGCCALTGEGLHEGVGWLIRNVR